MKNTILKVLALVTITALPLSAKPAPKAFQSTKGYMITPPAGWQVNNSGLMGADVILFAPPLKNFAANLNVVIVKAAPGETLEKDKAGLAAMLPRAFNHYKMLAQSFTTVGGVRALSTTSNHQIGTPPRVLWMRQWSVLRNGQAYTFTATALDENHANYQAAFDTALKSVRWTK